MKLIFYNFDKFLDLGGSYLALLGAILASLVCDSIPLTCGNLDPIGQNKCSTEKEIATFKQIVFAIFTS